MMQNFTLETDADGIALVTFDCAGRTMNTITNAVLDDLDLLATQLRDDAAIRGAILRSGKPNGFCAGADLGEMEAKIADWRRAATPDELVAAAESAALFNRRFRAIEACSKPVVLALEGLALGGGLELALVCHHRVAASGAKIRLAFPEASIGLLPGAGGTQRLPRLMGIERALPHLLEGKPIPVETALETGVLHELVPPERLIETCRRFILDGGSAVAPWDQAGFEIPGGTGTAHGSPYAMQRVGGERGARYPSEANIVRAVFEGTSLPIDDALILESDCFLDTTRTPQAAAMVRTLFHARQAMGKAGPPDYAEALIAGVRSAWDAELSALQADGIPAAALRAIIGQIGGWAPDGEGTAPAAAGQLAMAEARLLDAASRAATSFLRARDIANTDIADLVLVDAGFPAWTGGPVAWRRDRPAA
ncbi:enoyl-CoA hydratase-related protein [Sphingomonas sp. AOB5]|uniref:enoyl-CoA hydratase-related protein n=1 Tax=Sphingomonas sp. AOB5 TaxID=3034017 RepID=UPI0023F8E378|nr:enoyl-CoA hydratase-related protein [Sphingomonas sp. AOB5]MDF7774839.1 enoyl-CoA hydratase-related protein [Sphingomonas sp. AOB5]